MKYFKLLVAAIASGLAAGSAQASLCAMDQKPAATLLVPYFEVDISACSTPATARTTTFWVRNLANQPQLAQVSLWSNLGIATFGFYVYLPPLSAQRVNLLDVFCGGRLPSSGRAVSANSPFDADATNENFAGCNAGTNPENGPPVTSQLDAAFVFELQGRHTGRRSALNGVCYGIATEASSAAGDPVARGYITIDDVNGCGSGLLPSDSPYSIAVLEHDNVYVGGWQIVDPAQNFAFGGAAVGIESVGNPPSPPGVFLAGSPTFYGRYNNATASDGREPLPAAWAATTRAGGVLGEETSVILWRDQPKRNPTNQVCNRNPSPPFTDAVNQRLFDDTGQSTPPPVIFPGQTPPENDPLLATQRIDPDEFESTNAITGNTIGGLAYVNTAFIGAPYGPPTGQAWMGTVQVSEGRYSDIAVGTAIGSGCDAGTVVPADVSGPRAQNLNTRNFLFHDGFED